MALISGGEIFVRALRDNGIQYVFGVSGTTVTDILDGLVRRGMKFILAPHESCSIGMADGYARASGTPGVVLVHDSAGTAHLIGGLLNAQADRSPVVAVAGLRNVFSPSMVSPNATYETVEMTKALTKWSWQVLKAEDIEQSLSRALDIACSPPAGPVFLGIPKRILAQRLEGKKSGPPPPRFQEIQGDPVLIERAARLLLSANHPVFVAGSDVRRSGGFEEFKALAELVAARVVAEHHIACAAFPSDSPYFLGGHFENPRPVAGADVLLGAGCRLFMDQGPMNILPIPPRTRVIHLHEDRWEIGREFRTDLGILCNVKAGLRELGRLVAERITEEQKSLIRQRAAVIRREKDRLLAAQARAVQASSRKTSAIAPLTLFGEMEKRLGPDRVIVEESPTMREPLLATLTLNHPEAYFSRFACLGWGLPAAVGIKLALPKKEVIACLGDGAVMFSPQAFWTAARFKVPIKVIILNNRGYQAIRVNLKKASKLPDRRDFFMGCDFVSPEIDFVKLAGAFEIPARRICRPEEIGPALEDLLAAKGPAVLDVIIEQELAKPRGWK